MKLPIRSFANIVHWLASHPIEFFIVTSLAFGLALIILVPPFQVPDEFTHFTRAYEVSVFKTAHRHHQGKVDTKGSQLPISIYLTRQKTWMYHRPGAPDVPQANKYSLAQTTASLKIPLDKSNVSYYDTGSSPAYVPLVYAPQAIVIKLLSWLNAPVIVMLYVTRLVGLLIWVALSVVALRVMRPTKRRLAGASLLLIPMFIAQAASPSTDALLTGVTVLFLAFITNMMVEKDKLSTKKFILLVALLTVMIMAKPVYIAFGLLLFVPRTKWSGLKGIAFKATCIAIPLVLYGLWLVITKDTGSPLYVEAIAASHAAPSMQVGYLVPNILNFFQPFLNSLLLGWGDGTYVSLIGDFGKLDTPLPLFFITFGYMLALVAIFAEVESKQEESDNKPFYARKGTILLALLTSLVFVTGVYLAMYVYSTPPHEKIVTGVQGRYLLPLLPLLLLFMPKVFTTSRKVYEGICLLSPLILLLVSVAVIWLRYFTHYPG